MTAEFRHFEGIVKMAMVRKFSSKEPERVSKQSETEATIAIIEFDGEKFIQLDSVGSADRKFVGKRSQSLRLSKEAFGQLVQVGNAYFSEGK